MRLPFHKYHGLGNDFALIDARSLDVDFTGSLGRRLCERHTGVGADGLLLWTGSAERPRMQVVNVDGSVPEMCGNGIRCFVKHIADHFQRGAAEIAVETGAGLLHCGVVRDGRGAVETVAVAMGKPSFEPGLVPIQRATRLFDEAIAGTDPALRWTAVGIGNPHVVTLSAVTQAQRAELGPLLSSHPLFPNATNVEFVQILPPGEGGAPRLQVDVYERGCGWTQACGTGATAAAFAAVRLGALPEGRELAVRLPGGWLGITIEPDGGATMRGPATWVFDGEIDLDTW